MGLKFRENLKIIALGSVLLILLITGPLVYVNYVMQGRLTVTNRSGLDVRISVFINDFDLGSPNELLVETSLEEMDSVAVGFSYTLQRYPEMTMHVKYLLEYRYDYPPNIQVVGIMPWRTDYVTFEIDREDYEIVISVGGVGS